jgi:hypothetical protein
MRTRAFFAAALAVLIPSVAPAWSHESRPPDTVVVDPGSGSIRVWPYTGTDFSGEPSDPISFFFAETDPRAIRQALLALDGDRTSFGFPSAPPFDCRWADAMGEEQTSWASERGWEGSEIQVACVHDGAPLGDPFRFHLRLFRQGRYTLGGAHFELLIPHTAQHAVLSWELAEQLVTADMVRTGHLTALPSAVALFTPVDGSFRAVQRLVFDGLAADPMAAPLLALLGLVAPADPTADVPIPTDGVATSLVPDLRYRPRPEHRRLSQSVAYDTPAPKPVCSTGPFDWVYITGPVNLVLDTWTDWRGNFYRRYAVDGQLAVAPFDPITRSVVGAFAPARVFERHDAVTGRYFGEVRERGSQTLFADPVQSISWSLAAGAFDRYRSQEVCN